MWVFPGGHVDADEPSLETAAVREVVEETGLTIAAPKPVAIWQAQVTRGHT